MRWPQHTPEAYGRWGIKGDLGSPFAAAFERSNRDVVHLGGNSDDLGRSIVNCAVGPVDGALGEYRQSTDQDLSIPSRRVLFFRIMGCVRHAPHQGPP